MRAPPVDRTPASPAAPAWTARAVADGEAARRGAGRHADGRADRRAATGEGWRALAHAEPDRPHDDGPHDDGFATTETGAGAFARRRLTARIGVPA